MGDRERCTATCRFADHMLKRGIHSCTEYAVVTQKRSDLIEHPVRAYKRIVVVVVVLLSNETATNPPSPSPQPPSPSTNHLLTLHLEPALPLPQHSSRQPQFSPHSPMQRSTTHPSSITTPSHPSPRSTRASRCPPSRSRNRRSLPSCTTSRLRARAHDGSSPRTVDCGTVR